MPVNCPINEPAYNACLACNNYHKGKCFYDNMEPRFIRDILTDREQLAIMEDRLIEDRLATTPTPAANLKNDYNQLLKRVLLLEEKLNAHLDKSIKPKSKYN